MFFKNFFLLSILTAVVVASWIGLSVWHNVTTTTIDKNLQIKISPIPDKFDTKVTETLKNRRQVQIDLSAPPVFLSSSSRTTSTSGAGLNPSNPASPPATEPAQLDPGTEL